jgi:hypothetical protein
VNLPARQDLLDALLDRDLVRCFACDRDADGVLFLGGDPASPYAYTASCASCGAVVDEARGKGIDWRRAMFGPSVASWLAGGPRPRTASEAVRDYAARYAVPEDVLSRYVARALGKSGQNDTRAAIARDAVVCEVCGDPVEQKATGRPRHVHDGTCRRILNAARMRYAREAAAWGLPANAPTVPVGDRAAYAATIPYLGDADLPDGWSAEDRRKDPAAIL